ncbi:small-conductance mechanosensitive channel MscMJ [Halalkalicoccus paucihalophilus]|uniref:Small-conductance mechanosensitive channel MscMJ n=1 Tax=Halalkalicoccus paucihalophilus TaxID=1008153 RepID=A0A151ACC0_9EURY|nr:mechanosensitive ion channel family protein [Halalkalicoccus paucihalophilus]KYH25346.1 small-conductance mechanosensitive channel MscMJ [Halalkalicoccus paucihalophilus]
MYADLVAVWSVLWTLRPDPIPEIQQTYFSTIGIQLLTTAVLVVLVVLSLTFGRRLESIVEDRYDRHIGEASRIVWLLFVIAAGIYVLSVVWHVTYFVRLVLETLVIGRWTAIQQLITASIVLVAYLLIRFVNRSIDELQGTSSLTKHQSEVAYHVADIGIALGAMTLILTLWGVDLTNIFIGAGAITAIVGLAARETLAAVLAGFILLFSRPFRVGDWIEVQNHSGIVKDVTIFNTKIQTFSDEHVLVPNDIITESDLTNLSRNDQLRVEVEVGIDYETDVHHAREVVVEAVEDLDSIRSSPDPHVIAKRFADSSILLEVRVWIGEPTMRRRWNARTDAIEAIKVAFDREGITIPYPQRVQSARGERFPVEDVQSDRPTTPQVESE